jgi:hypothetical protein
LSFFDTFIDVDTRWVMGRLLGKTTEFTVGFCRGCVSVCDRRRRADEFARQTLDQLLRQGRRLA